MNNWYPETETTTVTVEEYNGDGKLVKRTVTTTVREVKGRERTIPDPYRVTY